jgi:hypothetical protein
MRISHSPAFTDTAWIPYEATASLPFDTSPDSDWISVLYAQFQDSMGNISAVYSTTYWIDVAPPVGFAQVEPGPDPLRTVTITAWDYQSGLAEIWLSPDYFFLEDVTVMAYTDSFLWDFSESPVVYMMLVDHVGNFSERIDAVLFEEVGDGGENFNLFLPLVIK